MQYMLMWLPNGHVNLVSDEYCVHLAFGDQDTDTVFLSFVWFQTFAFHVLLFKGKKKSANVTDHVYEKKLKTNELSK